MSTEWFIKTGDEIKGPFLQSALEEMARAGFIHKEDFVRGGDHGDWAVAGSLENLFPPAAEGGLEELTSLDDLNVDFGGGDSEPEELTNLDDLDITLSSGNESSDEPQLATSLDDFMVDITGPESEPAPSPKAGVPVAVEESLPEVPRQTEPVEESSPVPDPVTPPLQPAVPAIAPEALWFCSIRGIQYGPVQIAQLTDWAMQGLLTQTDFIRATDSMDWIPVATMPQIFSGHPAPVQGAAPQPDMPQQPVAASQPAVNLPPPPKKKPKPKPPVEVKESKPKPPVKVEESKPVPEKPIPKEPAAEKPTAPEPVAKEPAVPEPVAAAPKPVEEKPTPAVSKPNTTGALMQDANAQAIRAQMGMGAPAASAAASPARLPAGRSSSSSSSSSGESSLSLNALKEFAREKPVVLVLLGLAMPILLWMYSPFGAGSGQSEYDSVMVVYEEFKKARDAGGDGIMDQLKTKTEAQFKPLIARWQKTAIGENKRALKFVLFATRDGLMLMFDDSREKPGKSEKIFLDEMENAKSHLGGGK